ncbi:hypothetical protein [Teredinibacter sp. KSP-S5-2]|uniref:hypothetical protein n=1 Tax=Teredinibacter sp. KSP-S5-2 TaxID=3034506 RepID=UPI002935177B|nr:hypothetical protein [Teredinibacter sp. KSP-S5-2]WNO10456.1 hypothetical protein P5V12_04655 [Teredinibacter sp. KSP-S5-2]
MKRRLFNPLVTTHIEKKPSSFIGLYCANWLTSCICALRIDEIFQQQSITVFVNKNKANEMMYIVQSFNIETGHTQEYSLKHHHLAFLNSVFSILKTYCLTKESNRILFIFDQKNNTCELLGFFDPYVDTMFSEKNIPKLAACETTHDSRGIDTVNTNSSKSANENEYGIDDEAVNELLRDFEHLCRQWLEHPLNKTATPSETKLYFCQLIDLCLDPSPSQEDSDNNGAILSYFSLRLMNKANEILQKRFPSDSMFQS